MTGGMSAVSEAAPEVLVQSIIDIYAEVLDETPDAIDAASDFFECGGNSLMAAVAVAHFRRGFGIRLTVRDLFDTRTPQRVSELVAARLPVEG